MLFDFWNPINVLQDLCYILQSVHTRQQLPTDEIRKDDKIQGLLHGSQRCTWKQAKWMALMNLLPTHKNDPTYTRLTVWISSASCITCRRYKASPDALISSHGWHWQLFGGKCSLISHSRQKLLIMSVYTLCICLGQLDLYNTTQWQRDTFKQYYGDRDFLPEETVIPA